MSRVIDMESLTRRFSERVLIDDGCWQWIGARNERGYGFLAAGRGHTIGAHRVAVLLSGREIPDGYQVDHLCKNTSCVRFDHLDVVTPRVNNLRSTAPSALNAAKERCHRGHEFTRVERKSGSRVCRECKLASQRARREVERLANPPARPGEYLLVRTHCPAGHPYDDVNTYLARRADGGVSRMCRECGRQRCARINSQPVACPDCAKSVTRRNLAAHRRRMHGAALAAIADPAPTLDGSPA